MLKRNGKRWAWVGQAYATRGNADFHFDAPAKSRRIKNV